MKEQELQLNTYRPDMVLRSQDRFFLAIATKSLNNLTYVYTIFCKGNNRGRYDAKAETNIAIFKSAEKAMQYVATVKAMIDFQKKSRLAEIAYNFNARRIKEFNESVR